MVPSTLIHALTPVTYTHTHTHTHKNYNSKNVKVVQSVGLIKL